MPEENPARSWEKRRGQWRRTPPRIIIQKVSFGLAVCKTQKEACRMEGKQDNQETKDSPSKLGASLVLSMPQAAGPLP